MPATALAKEAPQPKRPSSPRRLAASRANGKLSRGPLTPQGKRNSAGNNRIHGLANPAVPTHADAAFAALFKEWFDHYQPTTSSERNAIERLAVAEYFLLRARRHQTETIDAAIAAQDPTLPLNTRIVQAYKSLGSTLDTTQRYETRYLRQYERLLHYLNRLQERKMFLPAEPTLKIEQEYSFLPAEPELLSAHGGNNTFLPPEPNPKTEQSPSLYQIPQQQPALLPSQGQTASECASSCHPDLVTTDPFDSPNLTPPETRATGFYALRAKHIIGGASRASYAVP